MTYNEIMLISDLSEKNEKLEDYYINDVGINEWLLDTHGIQKILFRDRFEVKKNGEYHNLSGPAIKYKNGTEYYWINGKYFEDKIEWEKKSKQILRTKKLKKVLDIDI